MRRLFLQEILAEVGLSENLKQSGLLRLEGEFTAVDWTAFYSNAKTVRLVIFHASHTLTMSIGKAVKEAAEAGTEFEVILPDFGNKSLLGKLASMEGNASSNSMKMKIQQAADGFKTLRNGSNSVQLYVSPHVHPFAMYLSDKQAIIVLNPEPTFSNPVVLVCDQAGGLYQYANAHYAVIKRDSVLLDVA
ncbi:MAG: hypothetical protein KDA66_09695 [Planctomycetaceae bacterium]|nr:hypothetical protein [Planctomycetaceae bacterium]